MWLHRSLSRAALLTVASAALLVACGGKVVVEAEGASGGGGSGGSGVGATATTSASAVTSGGTGGCEGLQADLVTKVATAQACNPALSVPQCSGSNVVLDLCGCSVVANDSSFEAGQSAALAFKTWVGAGCGPFDCKTCPPGPSTAWYCDSTASVCKPAFEK